MLAVNKMDLVDWDKGVFDEINAGVSQICRGCRPDGSGVCSDFCAAGRQRRNAQRVNGMVFRPDAFAVSRNDRFVHRLKQAKPFRMPVQWVNRPNQDFRGYSGTIASGVVRPGDRVAVLPSGQTTQVARIVTMSGDLESAAAGAAVTLTISDEIDVSRGDVVADERARPTLAEQFAAHLIWMSDQPMLPGRSYHFASGTNFLHGQVTELKYKINVNSLEHVAAKHLDLNEIGFCNIALDRRIPIDAYSDNRDMGAFVLIDRLSNATVACGMIAFPLRRGANTHWQPLKIDKAARATAKSQKPCILWFTGLSGAGKSTLADMLDQKLYSVGRHTIVLDGDNIRHGLNRDLGFTDEDRVENIRRIAEVAKLMVDAGLIVLVSFISPFRNERQMARDLVGPDEFVEIYVNTPIEVCEARDPKGLYRLARAGKLPNLTGIGSTYEQPEDPEIIVDGASELPEELAERIVSFLKERRIV